MFSKITSTRQATAITIAAVATVTAVSTAATTTIKACVKKSGGAMRQVGNSTKCKSSEVTEGVITQNRATNNTTWSVTLAAGVGATTLTAYAYCAYG